jgi:hypothetical protein
MERQLKVKEDEAKKREDELRDLVSKVRIVVANWPNVRTHKSKGANKEWSGRTNLRRNFGNFGRL